MIVCRNPARLEVVKPTDTPKWSTFPRFQKLWKGPTWGFLCTNAPYITVPILPRESSRPRLPPRFRRPGQRAAALRLDGLSEGRAVLARA